jgi:hypothetical protein
MAKGLTRVGAFSESWLAGCDIVDEYTAAWILKHPVSSVRMLEDTGDGRRVGGNEQDADLSVLEWPIVLRRVEPTLQLVIATGELADQLDQTLIVGERDLSLVRIVHGLVLPFQGYAVRYLSKRCLSGFSAFEVMCHENAPEKCSQGRCGSWWRWSIPSPPHEPGLPHTKRLDEPRIVQYRHEVRSRGPTPPICTTAAADEPAGRAEKNKCTFVEECPGAVP